MSMIGYESTIKTLKHDKCLESTWHAWPYLEHDIEICETKGRLVDSFCLLQQRETKGSNSRQDSV